MVTYTSTRNIEPDITVVEVSGRLALGNTLHSLELSLLKMIAGGTRKLLVDLSGLTNIDSAAIGVLMGCNGEMLKAGGSLRVVGARGSVADSFAVVRLGQVVALDSDVEAACRALAQGGAATV